MATILACCTGNALCCAASGAVKCLCCILPCKLSVATRGMYALGFAASTTAAFLLKQYGGRLSKDPECGPTCYGYLAVNRISFGLVLYHAFLMFFTLGVKSSEDARAKFHNGFWPVKLLLLLVPMVGSFFMDDHLFYPYWIVALTFSCLFILLQNVILIDFAHSLAEGWIQRFEDTGNATYRTLLIGSSILLYAGAITGTILLFVYFTTGGPECDLNRWFGGINSVSFAIVTFVSIHPKVREHTPTSGLLQAGVVSLYVTYVTASAINTNPASCSRTARADDNLQDVSVIVGIAVTFLSLGYSAVSAGSSSKDLWKGAGRGDTLLVSGSYTDERNGDDEKDGVVYSYSFLHFVFVLAAFYLASVVNNWMALNEEATSTSPSGNTIMEMSIDKGTAAMWVKAITSWVVALLYLWTLLAPAIFTERRF